MSATASESDIQTAVKHDELLNTLGDVIFTLDTNGYYTYVNIRVQRLLGYTPAEVIGQHYEKLIAPLWCEHIRSLYDRVLQGKDSETLVEIPLINRKGTDVWVEQMVTPVHDANDRVTGLAGVMRDLTGRNLTEAELEKRVNQMVALQRIDAELTHHLDVDYVLSMALDAALRLSAADAGGIELIRDGELYTGTIIGNYPPEFLHSYPKPPTGIVARVLNQRRPELVQDVRQDPDYQAYIPATRAQMTIPLLSQDRLIGVLFLETRRPERFTTEAFEFIQLITTRIAAALDNAQLYDTTRQQLAELQDLYTQISSLEQLKTDMIRIAAHDLGNPLTSISGFIDLLLDSKLTDTQREHVQIVKDSATRMKKIIRDILSLQRIEELAQGNLNETIELVELVQQVYDTQKYPAAHRSQTFTLDVTPYPMYIKGDAAQMREAIVNLISNALKYTPEGGEVNVRLREEDDLFIFEVIDNGYGIPEEQQARLFQPFFRAKTSETMRIDGTGLGLHLVKNIIERHHGKIRFRSVYGQGSLFGFEIPVPM
ncbi:MAG TPA: PAS domain-containing sensor histidine kinase [Spirillospora sp.]|nr:PAS domain-containing sensor histidine kinase [Spirillospora sp.]